MNYINGSPNGYDLRYTSVIGSFRFFPEFIKKMAGKQDAIFINWRDKQYTSIPFNDPMEYLTSANNESLKTHVISQNQPLIISQIQNQNILESLVKQLPGSICLASFPLCLPNKGCFGTITFVRLKPKTHYSQIVLKWFHILAKNLSNRLNLYDLSRERYVPEEKAPWHAEYIEMILSAKAEHLNRIQIIGHTLQLPAQLIETHRFECVRKLLQQVVTQKQPVLDHLKCQVNLHFQDEIAVNIPPQYLTRAYHALIDSLLENMNSHGGNIDVHLEDLNAVLFFISPMIQ